MSKNNRYNSTFTNKINIMTILKKNRLIEQFEEQLKLDRNYLIVCSIGILLKKYSDNAIGIILNELSL